MFSSTVERALNASIEAHAGQFRKGGAVPYVVHPLHVALMLARHGCDDDVVAAGLLHDVVEDCPEWPLARVESEFGSHVAGIVAQLTEDKSLPSWDDRKRRAIEHIAHLSPEAAAVKACDKLHNLHTLRAQLREAADPAEVWARFNGGREGTLRVAREVVEALCRRVDPRLARALRAAHEAVGEAAGERPQQPTA